ncbi:MAG: hypothetical protein WCJ09_03955 [Planctomycetota bacterium]
MSRILFQLTAFATTAFIITILAMVAMILGDPMAPIAVWFNQQGMVVMMVEVVAIIVLGLSAMTADRRETLRAKQASSVPTDAKVTEPEQT